MNVNTLVEIVSIFKNKNQYFKLCEIKTNFILRIWFHELGNEY